MSATDHWANGHRWPCPLFYTNENRTARCTCSPQDKARVRVHALRQLSPNKLRAYVCGPMAGRPDMGVVLFQDGAAEVEGAGDEAVVPHSLTPYQHAGPCPELYPPSAGAEPDHNGGCYLRGDVAVMVLCEYVYRLPGWEKSKGATIETAIAQALGIPIVDAPPCTCGEPDTLGVVHRLGGNPCYVPEP